MRIRSELPEKRNLKTYADWPPWSWWGRTPPGWWWCRQSSGPRPQTPRGTRGTSDWTAPWSASCRLRVASRGGTTQSRTPRSRSFRPRCGPTPTPIRRSPGNARTPFETRPTQTGTPWPADPWVRRAPWVSCAAGRIPGVTEREGRISAESIHNGRVGHEFGRRDRVGSIVDGARGIASYGLSVG